MEVMDELNAHNFPLDLTVVEELYQLSYICPSYVEHAWRILVQIHFVTNKETISNETKIIDQISIC